MANIIWTPPSGWVEETGAHVSFKAPCDCTVAGSLVIGSNSYSIVDALGKVITGTGGAFASGAVLDFILDCENSKAYLQNAATGLTLLWTNSIPSSSFAAQTVSLSLSSYTMVAVLFAYASSINTIQQVVMLPVNGMRACCSFYYTASSSLRAIRDATAKTTGVVFGGGYCDNGGILAHDIYAVPLKIYGIN